MRNTALGLIAASLVACSSSGPSPEQAGEQAGDETLVAAAPTAGPVSLTRLDCGRAEFKDMNGFFSDRPGVYPAGPGKVVDSCYLIRHGDDLTVWDTGFPATAKEKPLVMDGMTAHIDRTLVEQLQQLGVKPEDVDVVGISHMHGDHVGQAAQFATARLLIGKGDFERLEGQPEDTLKVWRGPGKNVTLAAGDTDVFGDGSVVAIHLPGHTPDHLGLLVRLKSGAVLLTGDLYHSTIAREKRAVPGFNTSREQTLESMDKFEALARRLGAKVVIQHEPSDIAKLPAFPKAAE
jgi:glyoxylase-like metal-dependent hydrolase (beta-lactamase superfamily II)